MVLSKNIQRSALVTDLRTDQVHQSEGKIRLHEFKTQRRAHRLIVRGERLFNLNESDIFGLRLVSFCLSFCPPFSLLGCQTA